MGSSGRKGNVRQLQTAKHNSQFKPLKQKVIVIFINIERKVFGDIDVF